MLLSVRGMGKLPSLRSKSQFLLGLSLDGLLLLRCLGTSKSKATLIHELLEFMKLPLTVLFHHVRKILEPFIDLLVYLGEIAEERLRHLIEVFEPFIHEAGLLLLLATGSLLLSFLLGDFLHRLVLLARLGAH